MEATFLSDPLVVLLSNACSVWQDMIHVISNSEVNLTAIFALRIFLLK
jgi:hypothetical protein